MIIIEIQEKNTPLSGEKNVLIWWQKHASAESQGEWLRQSKKYYRDLHSSIGLQNIMEYTLLSTYFFPQSLSFFVFQKYH